MLTNLIGEAYSYAIAFELQFDFRVFDEDGKLIIPFSSQLQRRIGRDYTIISFRLRLSRIFIFHCSKGQKATRNGFHGELNLTLQENRCVTRGLRGRDGIKV